MKLFFMSIVFTLFFGIYGLEVKAQQKYDLKEITPSVKSALDNRKARFSELQELKAQGVVGENNQGYVEVLKKGVNAESLVNAENKDRKLIYRAIEEQNNLQNALGTIEKVFGQVQRDKAKAGEKVQDEGGRWVTK